MTLKPNRKRHGFEVSTWNLSNCLRHEDLVLRPLHFVCWIWGTSKESKRKLIKIYVPATYGKIIDNLLFVFNTVQHPILIVCCFPGSSFIWQIIYSRGHLCFYWDRKSHVCYFPFDERSQLVFAHSEVFLPFFCKHDTVQKVVPPDTSSPRPSPESSFCFSLPYSRVYWQRSQPISRQNK